MLCLGSISFIYPMWDFDCELLIFLGKNICGCSLRPKKEMHCFKRIYLWFFFSRCLRYYSLVTRFILWDSGPPKGSEFGLQLCVWACLSSQSLRNPCSLLPQEDKFPCSPLGIPCGNGWTRFTSGSLVSWGWNFWRGVGVCVSQLYEERVFCWIFHVGWVLNFDFCSLPGDHQIWSSTLWIRQMSIGQRQFY